MVTPHHTDVVRTGSARPVRREGEGGGPGVRTNASLSGRLRYAGAESRQRRASVVTGTGGPADIGNVDLASPPGRRSSTQTTDGGLGFVPMPSKLRPPRPQLEIVQRRGLVASLLACPAAVRRGVRLGVRGHAARHQHRRHLRGSDPRRSAGWGERRLSAGQPWSTAARRSRRRSAGHLDRAASVAAGRGDRRHVRLPLALAVPLPRMRDLPQGPEIVP